MILRTKFILLIIGVTVFPFLLTGVTVALQYWFDGAQGPPHGFPPVRATIEKHLPRYLESGNASSLEKISNLGIPLIMYEEGRILLSTVPSFREGEAVPIEQLLAYADAEKNTHFTVQSYTRNGTEGTIFFLDTGRPLFTERSFTIGLAVYPISIIAFASILSLFIIRSINRSIRVLEQATREIAAGNLDFKLEPKGTDAFSSLSRSFKRMQDQLKEEQAKRSRFIMGVSHDLNTPLTLIEGYIDAINDGYADSEEKMKKYLQIIKGKSRILGGRIEQLIEFVNMETGQWKFVLKPVRLAGFLNQLAEVYRDEAEIMKYNFTSTIELPEELSVRLDEDLLRRVFDNLIQNAVRYSGRETTAITLSGDIEAEKIILKVANRGAGIPAEEQKLIFEPFYRGNRGEDHKGFGLGLSSVKSVVEAHGWEISLSSAPGETTAFSILIPLSSTSA